LFQHSRFGVFHSLGIYPHFFFPPFFAFLAVVLPWFCLDCFPPADPFLPLFADLDMDRHLLQHLFML